MKREIDREREGAERKLRESCQKNPKTLSICALLQVLQNSEVNYLYVSACCLCVCLPVGFCSILLLSVCSVLFHLFWFGVAVWILWNFFEVVRRWGFGGSAELWTVGEFCLIVEEDVFVKQRACFFNSSVSRRREIQGDCAQVKLVPFLNCAYDVRVWMRGHTRAFIRIDSVLSSFYFLVFNFNDELFSLLGTIEDWRRSRVISSTWGTLRMQWLMENGRMWRSIWQGLQRLMTTVTPWKFSSRSGSRSI